MEEADSVDLNGNGPSVTMVFDGGFDTDEAFNVTDLVLDGASVNSDSMNADEAVDAVATAGAAENNANKSVWVGEQAAIISDSTSEDLYVQRADGTFVASPATAANNQIYIFNSANRDTGEYHVDFDGDERRWNAGGDEVVLKLRDLGLDIEADDTSIDDGDDAEADVSANTGSRALRLGVQDDDGDFVSGKNMTDMLDPSTEETFNFGTLDDGDYTYYVEDLRTGISATSDTVTVSETDEDVEFNESSFSEHRGDVMNITVDLTDTDTATIGLGPYDDTGYGWNVTVENDDDNDYVTLQWNTFAASGSSNDVSVHGDDNLVSIVDSQSDVGGPSANDIISSGTYDLDVRVGDDPADDADDVATATIQPRSTDAVNTWTAPGAEAADIEDEEDVYDRIGINITQDDTIAEGDLLISQIEASGLQGAIYAENRDDPTDAFAELSGWHATGQADNAMSLALNQSNTQLNQAPKSTDFGQAHANDAVALIPDYENDTYFVAWTLGDADFEQKGTDTSLEDGDRFVTNFTVFSYEESSSDYGLVAPDNGDFADETVTSEWEFVDAEMSINTQRGDVVRLRAQDNQTISGTSTVATGSEHDIRVQTVQGSTNAFLLGPEDVTVENGTWSVEFDLSDRQPGTELDIEARDDVADTEEEDGLVMDEPTVQALTFEDQDSGGSSVTVQEAQLSDGGFIAIHEGSASGDVLGTTRYIDPGEEATNLGVGLSSDVSDGTTLVAMPHLDTNSNERFDFPDADGPYTEDGSPVTESATITVRGEQTPPPTPTPQVITATPPDTPTPRVVTVTPEETPGQDGPGFGVVVALIALIAAALLAVRRNN
jgi:PGF-CTERM protein